MADYYEDEHDEFEYADGIYLPPEERRGGPSDEYTCVSDPKLGLKADTEPEARLYCSMKAFIERQQISVDLKSRWFNDAKTIIREIIKLGPKVC